VIKEKKDFAITRALYQEGVLNILDGKC